MKLTTAQMSTLHTFCTTPGWVRAPRANQGVVKRLVALGALRHGASYKEPSYVVTTEGQAAHDAVYTPERLAADAAAEEQARQASRTAQDEARARMDAAAERRTASMARLRELLGDEAPYWVRGEATVHNDYSGISGGQSYDWLNADQLLGYIETALRHQN